MQTEAERRAFESNRIHCEKQLCKARITWTMYNDGAQFVVFASLGRVYEMQTETLSWKLRGQKLKGTGIRTLIQDIKREH